VINKLNFVKKKRDKMETILKSSKKKAKKWNKVYRAPAHNAHHASRRAVLYAVLKIGKVVISSIKRNKLKY